MLPIGATVIPTANRRGALDTDALNLVVGTMRSHLRSPEVMVQCCGVLKSVATVSQGQVEDYSVHGLKCTITAMQTYQAIAAVQRQGLVTICALAYGSPSCQKKLTLHWGALSRSCC